MGRARGQQNAVVGHDRFADELSARRGRDRRDHQLNARAYREKMSMMSAPSLEASVREADSFTGLFGETRGTFRDPPVLHRDAAVRAREFKRLHALIAVGKLNEPLRALGRLTSAYEESDPDLSAAYTEFTDLYTAAEESLYQSSRDRWAKPVEELGVLLGQPTFPDDEEYVLRQELTEAGIAAFLEGDGANITSASVDPLRHVDAEAVRALARVLADRTCEDPEEMFVTALGTDRFNEFSAAIKGGFGDADGWWDSETSPQKWQRVWERALTGVRAESLGSREDLRSALGQSLREAIAGK